jgi:hypothetical protein
MADRFSQLAATHRTLLELLAVSGRPVERDMLILAAGVRDQGAGALESLRDQHLIRHRRTGELEEIEIYHARMAKGVLSRLPAERLVRLHDSLATTLEGSGQVEPEILAHHYHEAGRLHRASEFAVIAADQAMKALAFNHAAELYAQALDHPPTDESAVRRIRICLGDALANARRGEEAARAYLAAAPNAPPLERLQLQERAVGQLFRAGLYNEGLNALRDLLPALHLKWPESTIGTWISIVARRVQLRLRGLSFRERPVTSISPLDLLRIDVCWSVSSGLCVIDIPRATLFQTECLLRSLDAGEPLRVTRSMAFEAVYTANLQHRSRARANVLHDRVAQLSSRFASPEAEGFVLVSRGITCYLFGEWKQATEILTRAETVITERSPGDSQELDNARVFAFNSLAYLGELPELARRLPPLVEDARERGDRYAQTMLGLRQSMMYLVADDPIRAKIAVSDAITHWSRAGFQTPHYVGLHRDTEAHLYLDDATQARARLLNSWPQLRRSLFLLNRSGRIEMRYLHARTALALSATRERRRMLRAATRDASNLERTGLKWGQALAGLIRAGIAATGGDRVVAMDELLRAERDLAEADMMLHVAVARRRRGELLGGSEGRALVRDADGWMTDRGILNPQRYTAMILPGGFG